MSHLSSWSLPEARAELEIAHGKRPMSDAEALLEANRCLYCYDAPCVKACPTSIEVPVFIKRIAELNFAGSAREILRANMLGVSCARVCPVEELCEGACVYNHMGAPPIQIGRLQRHACEKGLASETTDGRLFQPLSATGKKVALIGAGPASLACAAYLALAGVQAEIFEKKRWPGGLNSLGIAPYKWAAHEALEEVEWLLGHGAKLHLGQALGKELALDDLRTHFDAVFIGIGLGEDRELSVPGADGPGVIGATAWIERMKTTASTGLSERVRSVAVVGGGNTALDVVRELCAFSLPEVTLFYRRSEAEMSGYNHELAAARKAGAHFVPEAVPQAIRHSKEGLEGLEWKARQGGESHFYPCELVILAIGQESASQSLLPASLLENGKVKVNQQRQTPLAGVYAGGDCVNGGKEVVNAAADGREAAFAMLASWGLPRPL